MDLTDVFGSVAWLPYVISEIGDEDSPPADAWTLTSSPPPHSPPGRWPLARIQKKMQAEGGGRGLSTWDVLYLSAFLAWVPYFTLAVLGIQVEAQLIADELNNLLPDMRREMESIATKSAAYMAAVDTGQKTRSEVESDREFVDQTIDEIASGGVIPMHTEKRGGGPGIIIAMAIVTKLAGWW